jgi:hypothetical protein
LAVITINALHPKVLEILREQRWPKKHGRAADDASGDNMLEQRIADRIADLVVADLAFSAAVSAIRAGVMTTLRCHRTNRVQLTANAHRTGRTFRGQAAHVIACLLIDLVKGQRTPPRRPRNDHHQEAEEEGVNN